MPTPALRNRIRRPILSTAKAKVSDTSQAQIVRPPLMRAWFEELWDVSVAGLMRADFGAREAYFVMPIVFSTEER
jgi:hypothetical protein